MGEGGITTHHLPSSYENGQKQSLIGNRKPLPHGNAYDEEDMVVTSILAQEGGDQ